MTTNIFGTSISGLNAAQLGLATTSHNIANTNTPGYTRQQVEQTNAPPLLSGAGYVGQGTQVTTIKRLYNQFLTNQVSTLQTQASQFEAYHAQIAQIDNLLADPTAGLSPALQDFFNAIHTVANDPGSSTSRQSAISSAQTLVARFGMLDQRLAEIRSNVNSQIAADVDAINSYAKQLAQFNQNIILAQNAGQPPNDLLDQRDQLIADLNRLIRVTVVKQDDGAYNVFIGNGQSLVVSSQAFSLTAIPDRNDPSQTTVAASTFGSPIALQESQLQGGELGGLLAFRSQSLEPARNELGRIAIAVAGTFNDQHRLGQDLNGALGGSFFTLPPVFVMPSTANSGNAQIAGTFTNYSALTTSDYRLAYDGANYTLTRLSDGTRQSFTTFPQTVDGVTFTLASGAPGVGDQFLIRPAVNGAGGIAVGITDVTKIAAAAPIRTSAALANLGRASISAGTVNSFNDKVTLTFTGAGTFDVVDNTTGATLAKAVAYSAGGNISFNGWNVKINGAPVVGDTFTLNGLLTATTSVTATIGAPTLNSPSPTDAFLTNSVNVVFDSPTVYHLEGATTNVTGASSITGGTFAGGLPLAAGPNGGITVTSGAATIGAGGAGAYAATGVKVTISGGTIAVAAGIATISGATVTVEGGSYAGSTTFKGIDITVNNATGAISVPAAGASGIASTFNGRPATGIAYNGAASNLLSVNGLTAQLTGTAVAGDTFSIGQNTGGIADNRNALLLAGLQNRKTMDNGASTYQTAYGAMVGEVGIKAHQIDIGSQAQQSALSQARQAQQGFSGVNLDEEAANLVRYQQAYQASGKVMQIAQKLFDTLLNL